MLVVSGDAQSGTVATELPKPVVIQVLSKGRAVSGQVVNFVVTTASDPLNPSDGGVPSIADTAFKGKVFAGTAITDSNGRAQDYWTLGGRTSYPQKLEVRATDRTTGKQVFASFTATALPGPATRIAASNVGLRPDAGVDGGSGSGAGSSVTEAVGVYDVLGNPANNVLVTFTVTAGGGTVSPTSVKTSADGTASATWTLGTKPNLLNSLAASAAGVAGSVTWQAYVGCSSGSSCSYNSGVCIDVQSDSNNCGRCGNACPSGSTCTSGSCRCTGVDGGAVSLCGITSSPVCADLQRDPNNCGWCGRTCPAGVACSGGACVCPPNGGNTMTLCSGKLGDECVDLQHDPNNCGMCNRQCPTGTACNNGNCACPGSGLDGGASLSLCPTPNGNVCVDLQSDPNNCGWCGRSCGSGACVNGSCQCPGGIDGGAMSLCSDKNGNLVCIDLQQDNNNCGWCGNQCPAGTTCASGACQCPNNGNGSALSLCGDVSGNRTCVDLQQDSNNCGGCGNRCPAQANCVAGACQCNGGASMCWTGSALLCTDTKTDSSNCGYCGHHCPASSSCVAGVCQCAGGGTACETTGGLVCADLQSDPSNCGGCGASCPVGQSFLCREGRCVYCPQDTIYCSGRGYCTDPLNDAQNCGGCGLACKPNAWCSRGQCSCGGATDCGDVCADLSSDPNNCGACGTKCTTGQRSCSAGECALCSDLGTGWAECDNQCTDTRFDDKNCGTCGSRCTLNQACVQSVCVSGQ
jgi:hypothetical protein